MLPDRSEAWREELRKKNKNKDRIALERVGMPEVDAQERIKHQDVEVNCGLSSEDAQHEAIRCMDCANPTCISGCPVGINIPKFIKEIELGEFVKAASTLKDKSALPAVCGRVCPQEKQCEAQCFYTQKLKKPAVAIGYLERFAADYARENDKNPQIPNISKNGKKIAAVGSGPASLSFAGDMIKKGYDVTVFEALHEIGGVLKYGIPEFRLPNDIVEFEIDNLRKMGVKFETNFVVGRTASFEDLKEQGYEAFFVGSGAGLPRFMGILGENLNGVFSANEYLTRVNLMEAYQSESETPVLKGKRVAIIGGGNTAMDSVRTARRLGAEKAMIVYRRSMDEIPARVEEVNHAIEEGVEFKCLHNPVSYQGDENGRIKSMKLQVMELGEADASGRRRPIPVEGKFIEEPVDLVIVSVGVSPNPLIPSCLPSIRTSEWGTVLVNEDNMQSDDVDVFAGGDIVRGGATVILAMGDGRKAAESMDDFLTK
ncbi:NADPH-dependent glutamate synthase [Halosquirtibacter xylanolyticus]|uniref:NADPH-dependent glutamate synthase n=1 Tax=Halosquirtibacter xylanolyticus TaxID=3374599 RepID=UPI003749B4D3|nr:NADPH-dependent glutamate synthase [Prolixibacteraceae bacterium]